MTLMNLSPVEIEGHTFLAVSVQLPKTNLLVVTSDKGYIMCGALDVGLLNEKLKDRKIIAGRAVGVKTIQQLIDAPLESVTHEAEQLGITSGMPGREALLKMI
ncbi:YunC family protein [Rossellomorea aquimaris]